MKRYAKRLVTGLAGCSAMFVSHTVAAEVSGSLGFTTNYYARGYSKSGGHPALKGNLDYEHDAGFFAGTWVAMVDFNDAAYADRAEVEMVPYVGWHWPLSDDWSIDSYGSRYFYDGKLFGAYSDYNELNVIMNFRDLATLRVAWSEDFYHRGHSAFDYELTLRYAFTDTLEASTGIGFSDTFDALRYNYLYWNAGLSWYFKYGSMDLRYVQASQSGQSEHEELQHFEPKMLDGDVVFSLSVGF